MFYHSITKFVFLISSGSGAICHFSRKSDHKKEKTVVSFRHEQNIICAPGTRLLFIVCDEKLRWAGGRHVFCRNRKPRMKSLWQPVYIIFQSQTQLDDIAHEQTIICRQLFVGHVVGFWPMKRRKICIQ